MSGKSAMAVRQPSRPAQSRLRRKGVVIRLPQTSLYVATTSGDIGACNGGLAGDTSSVHLAEWRTWWNGVGRQRLADLLSESWDPFTDASFRDDVSQHIDTLGRRLHEGAGALDVQVFL